VNLRDALFSPRSVAIVGQSDDPGKTAGRPLKFLRQMGYAGRVYPVNARRETVLGERAWPTLAALPEPPEHVYIVTPTEAAVAAVEDCARLGVKVATVLADGFAEAGSQGLAREARLRAACAASGMRVVGPSSLGVVDLRSKAMLTANAAFDETELPVGRIFAASHSGSLIGALLTRGKARGIAFAGLVSVGNEVDLSLGDICAATLDDPGIDGYMLFLETMRHAEGLRRFALAAAARGKPIIAYKLGRSAAARELAVSHTGALAGEDDVADVFLKSCGIARVDTLEALLEGQPLLTRVPATEGGGHKRVGVVTTTAGGATMVVDPLASRGVTIEPASAATLARLAAAGIEVKPARLVDLTIAGARYETMKAALDILLAAPEFDLVLAVVGSSARAQPEATVRPIIDSAGAGKPLAAFLVPDAPEAMAALSRAGVPNFRTPEACADAIAAALSRRPPRPMAARSAVPAALASEASGQRGHFISARAGHLPGPGSSARAALASEASGQRGHFISARAGHSPEPGSSARAASGGRVLDELAAGALLDRLGIARAPVVALDARITHAPALPFSYPVAVKVLSAEIAHKSDVGGVALGIADGAALIAAIRGIRASVAERKPDVRVARVLVQPMVSGLGEVLIGYRVDRDVGPVMMVAAGGLFAEVARDRSLRLAPVDLAEAREMIAEVRALAPLAGYRGRSRGDLDALAQAIVALSRLAGDPAVVEAEINPLIVRPAGASVVAVDTLVKLAGSA
jgi:acyl-CoA synthetase (NDP forming)